MINEQIRDREVRLIGPDGEQIGVVSSREAQKIADEAGLDLVKIAPNAKPPVCKVIDYGKYRYELARKEKDAKKKQKTVELKEIRTMVHGMLISYLSLKMHRNVLMENAISQM